MWRSPLQRRLGLAAVPQPCFERALPDPNASESSAESFYRQLSNQVRPADCLDRAGNVVRRLPHREESVHGLILMVDLILCEPTPSAFLLKGGPRSHSYYLLVALHRHRPRTRVAARVVEGRRDPLSLSAIGTSSLLVVLGYFVVMVARARRRPQGTGAPPEAGGGTGLVPCASCRVTAATATRRRTGRAPRSASQRRPRTEAAGA
jgi:hypothetical protein